MATSPFWSVPLDKLFDSLGSAREGLTAEESKRRQLSLGPNAFKPAPHSGIGLFLAQFANPLIIILLFAAILSFFIGTASDALIILLIVIASGLLGFWQEYSAANAVEKLLELVQTKAVVLRGKTSIRIPLEHIVPGDVVVLSAGDKIPCDLRIIESNGLFVDESALTGETFPIQKRTGLLSSSTPLNRRTNSLFMGTHVVSGTALAIAAQIGSSTEYGLISSHLRIRRPQTEFELGVRSFGYLLMNVTFLLVISIFLINIWLARPIIQSFLFSLALAVGLTPQLLPAIVSINLATGAKHMAKSKVIVKRLASIENFGSMNVLCVDKTGTLTQGTVRVKSALDLSGKENMSLLRYAYLNASFQTGFANPIDDAIRKHEEYDVSDYVKLDEVPYDFVRKRLSVLARHGKNRLLITKGAFPNVISACSHAEIGNRKVALAPLREKITSQFETLSRKGFRILGIAIKTVPKMKVSSADENEMTFLGFIVLYDPLKPRIIETLTHLRSLGVSLKLITGDNHIIANYVGSEVGLSSRILTGTDLRHMTDEALARNVNSVDIFAEIEPNQKERIILALRTAGNVVGFLGDGINDAPALHAADVGISVDDAVSVAKEAADIVLLQKDLHVLAQGVLEGRHTFANTLKYVFIATSANFGNMFSMAGASLFLPFLPLLPKQILLTNLLTDIPEMTIATDSVDHALLEKPRRWNISFIKKFMITFGLVSSIFDYLTFGALIYLLHAPVTEFRTGWFVESVVSAAIIVLVVRTRHVFFLSPPGRSLFLATIGIVACTLILPYTPLAALLGFTALPLSFLGFLLGIVALYVCVAEITKHVFYRLVAF